ARRPHPGAKGGARLVGCRSQRWMRRGGWGGPATAQVPGRGGGGAGSWTWRRRRWFLDEEAEAPVPGRGSRGCLAQARAVTGTSSAWIRPGALGFGHRRLVQRWRGEITGGEAGVRE